MRMAMPSRMIGNKNINGLNVPTLETKRRNHGTHPSRGGCGNCKPKIVSHGWVLPSVIGMKSL